jgi:hypothetical protein
MGGLPGPIRVRHHGIRSLIETLWKYDVDTVPIVHKHTLTPPTHIQLVSYPLHSH